MTGEQTLTGLLLPALNIIFSVLSSLLFLLPVSSAGSGPSTSRMKKLDGIYKQKRQQQEIAALVKRRRLRLFVISLS
jgi:hypothetical protein